ncbi:MAG: hypothetical protein JST55_01695 [Bacteroidetes bacterium]|nr:hypothetical protein [Bacteroidota bacterium]
MIKTLILTISILLIYISDTKCQPQDSAKYVVDSTISESNLRILIENIVVTGNKVTDADIILREMQTKQNEYTTVDVLNRDLQRIYNLGLFTKVDMIPIPSSDKGYSLLITVEEGFYFLPIPIGGIKDGDLKKIWVGMNLKWRNFRGRNETVGLAFGVFYDPFVNVSYSIPWIGKNHHYFTSFDAGYSVNNNKSIPDDVTAPLNVNDVYTYKTFNWNTKVSVGKYMFKELSTAVSLGFNSTSTSDYIKDKTLSTDGTDNYLSAGYNINYDTRDSYEYTLAGISVSGNYLKYGFGDVINYNSIGVDLRKFIPIKLSDKYLISLGTRFNSTVFWGGNIADYHHSQLGYSRLIRGWDDYVFEGENSMIYSNELRIPIIQPFYIPGKELPIARKLPVLKDFSYKFGLYATLFYDVGAVWNKHDNIFNTRFYDGYGAGLNFILPFGFVGRADWGFRHQNNFYKGQLIFSLNSSF